MSLSKDPFWNKLSRERQRELLATIFKRCIVKPIIFLPIFGQIFLFIWIAWFSPEFEYKFLLVAIGIPIAVRLAFIPFSRSQLEEFQLIEGISESDYEELSEVEKDGMSKRVDDIDSRYSKIRIEGGKYSVQTRKYFVYYFKTFENYESAKRFVDRNPYISNP
jgi:hypothetical protein